VTPPIWIDASYASTCRRHSLQHGNEYLAQLSGLQA
jgi:hypothetical protein